MEKIHFRRLKDIILNKKKIIKSSIWKQLLDLGIDKQSHFLSEIDKFEDYQLFAQKKSSEASLLFFIDSNVVLNEYIKSVYGELDLIDGVEIDEQKRKNLNLFNTKQRELINQNIRFKSLIYFDNAISVIKTELELLTASEVKPEEPAPIPFVKVTPTVYSSEKLKAKVFNQEQRPKKRGVYIPQNTDNANLKDKGNTSEQIVYDYLLSQDFENVDWVSDDNEGLHYDIRYTNKEGVVKYVEVKSFDSTHFYLSREEFDFGKQNSDDYEIWLVQNRQNLIPIRDFYSNPKYQALPNEYLVYLEVKNN
jgi:hypothetical protein